MSRTFRLIAPALLALSLLLTLAGCARPVTQAQSTTVFAMDTVMELTVYGGSELLDGARDILTGMESRLSVTAPGSEISAINENGSATVSPDTAELIGDALGLCDMTGGALDITVYPIVRAWGFTTGQYRVPGQAEISELLEKVDYTAVSVDGSAVALPEGALLDLGAVTKGRAGDLIAEYWRDNRVKSGLLNLGGNVQAIGAKPDGSPWRIGVRDPFSQTYLGTVSVTDRAVVTSGGYERFFEEDGNTYWHIIDPADGYPADSGLLSVTVVGKSGFLCDGLSTALFVMGEDRAAELWRSREDFDAVLVTAGGEIVITEGLEGSFSPANGWTDEDVRVLRRDQD